MANKRKRLIIFTIVFLLGVLYVWRYVQLNASYQRMQTGWDEIHYLGEEVSLGENHIDNSIQANGYSIRVDAVQIVDTAEYMEEKGLPSDSRGASLPERLALLSATIKNKDNRDDSFPVLLFEVYGIDFYTVVDFELFNQINIDLQKEGWGIVLPQGTEHTVVIPFRLDRDSFNFYTWNHLAGYPLSMRLTYGPARIIIKLMEK